MQFHLEMILYIYFKFEIDRIVRKEAIIKPQTHNKY